MTVAPVELTDGPAEVASYDSTRNCVPLVKDACSWFHYAHVMTVRYAKSDVYA
jgi:hypothetical protein